MKAIAIVLKIFLFVFVFSQTGCEQPPLPTEPLPKAEDSGVSVGTGYAPVKLNIMPLSEFVSLAGTEGTSKINVYVSLLDSFGCQIKSPGVFRFEIYEYVQRSSEPKGKRIAIRPDIDLTDAVQNNKYWRDFLRAYQFNLPFEPADSRSYILQVTFLCQTGKRLTCEFALKRTQ